MIGPLPNPIEVVVMHRPVENCPFINPEDGCCAHPSAATPECWQVGPDRSDCPLRP